MDKNRVRVAVTRAKLGEWSITETVSYLEKIHRDEIKSQTARQARYEKELKQTGEPF